MFKWFVAFYFIGNAGGASIGTDLNKTYPRAICVQYLRILFRSFREEDFQSFELN